MIHGDRIGHHDLPRSGKTALTVGHLGQERHEVLAGDGTPEFLEEALALLAARVQVVDSVIDRHVIGLSLDLKRRIGRAVADRSHRRAKARGILPVLIRIVISEDNIVLLAMSVGHKHIDEHRPVVQDAEAQMSVVQCIGRNLLAGRCSSEFFCLNAHNPYPILLFRFLFCRRVREAASSRRCSPGRRRPEHRWQSVLSLPQAA